MPIPPKADLLWSCSECSWKRSLSIESDVFPPPPQKCPVCGGEVKYKGVVSKETKLLAWLWKSFLSSK